MADCAATAELGTPEYMTAFTRRAIRGRVPVTGAFDLTYRCNLRCVHCYAGHLVAQTPGQARERTTAEVLALLGAAADAGCLQLLLSGGEPLLRRDFVDIYVAARRLGMLVTVFTNATLVDDRVLDAFVEYTPALVEVSIYGATPATYELVTGVGGSHRRAWAGIHSLVARGVRVGLKTMILQDNLHEVQAMEAQAADLGCSFRLDPLVSPRLDGDHGPLAQRVAAEQAVQLELGTEARVAAAAAYQERQMAHADAPDLYRCGAGVMSFHLDPQGVLRPCLMSQHVAHDAVGRGFPAAWRAVVAAVEGLSLAPDSSCVGCPSIAICGYCPGLFALETGSPGRHSPYACTLGMVRSATIDDREMRAS